MTTLGVVTLPRCTAPVHFHWDRYFFILDWVFQFSGFLLGFFLLGFYMIYSWATLIFLVSEKFLNGIFPYFQLWVSRVQMGRSPSS